MKRHIITINGRPWLAGMIWRIYQTTPTIDDIQEMAGTLKANLYTPRITKDVIQAGFFRAPDDAVLPKHLSSLAARLADTNKQPWLGTFNLGGGLWWHVAIRDGHSILPDGDFIGTEEEVIARRDAKSGLKDWEYVDGDMEYIINAIKSVRTKPAPVLSIDNDGSSTKKIALALTILLLAGAAFGWHIHVRHEAERHALAMARERAILAAGGRGSGQPTSPLLTTPDPAVWLQACGKIIENLPISKDGWSVHAMSCANHAVHVQWKREDGATVSFRPEGEVDNSGNFVNESIPLPKLPHGKDDEESSETARIAILAWGQRIGFPVSIGSQQSSLPGADGRKKNNMNMKQLPVLIKSDLPPFDLDFSDIPGFRLTGLSSNNDGKWRVTGVLYVR